VREKLKERKREKERETAHSRTYARKVEAEFHIRSPLSKPGCRHIQAMFAMANTYIEPELRVRNVAFCRAFSTHTRAPFCLFRGKWRGRKSGVRNARRVDGSERTRPCTRRRDFSSFPIGTALSRLPAYGRFDERFAHAFQLQRWIGDRSKLQDEKRVFFFNSRDL